MASSGQGKGELWGVVVMWASDSVIEAYGLSFATAKDVLQLAKPPGAGRRSLAPGVASVARVMGAAGVAAHY